MSNTKKTNLIMKNQAQNTQGQAVTMSKFSRTFTKNQFKYIVQSAKGIKYIENFIDGKREHIENPSYNPDADFSPRYISKFVPNTFDSCFSKWMICLSVKSTAGIEMNAWFNAEIRHDGSFEISFDHIFNGGNGKKVRQPKAMIKKLVEKANKMILADVAEMDRADQIDFEIRVCEQEIKWSDLVLSHYPFSCPSTERAHATIKEMTEKIAELRSELELEKETELSAEEKAEINAEVDSFCEFQKREREEAADPVNKYKKGDRVAFANNGTFEGIIMDSRPSTNMQGDPAPDYLIREDHWSEDYPFAQEWRGECQIIGSVETPAKETPADLKLINKGGQTRLVINGETQKNYGCMRSEKKGFISALVIKNKHSHDLWIDCRFSKSTEPKAKLTIEELDRWEIIGVAHLETPDPDPKPSKKTEDADKALAESAFTSDCPEIITQDSAEEIDERDGIIKPERSVGNQGEAVKDSEEFCKQFDQPDAVPPIVDVFKQLGSMFDVRGSLDSLNVPKVSESQSMDREEKLSQMSSDELRRVDLLRSWIDKIDDVSLLRSLCQELIVQSDESLENIFGAWEDAILADC